MCHGKFLIRRSGDIGKADGFKFSKLKSQRAQSQALCIGRAMEIIAIIYS
jgi:hypothetical protein